MCKIAVTLMLLGTPILSHAQTSENSWAALNALHAGQRIEIIETNLKKHSGTFSTVTDEVIQMRQGSDDIGIRRENVARVTLLDKSHRLRNSLIFGGVGAGAGAGIGAAAYRCNAFCFVGRGVAVGFGGLVGLAGGAGIGAAIPSHPTIYRSEQR